MKQAGNPARRNRYLAVREHRPAWLRVDRLLGEHRIQQDTPVSRQEFERRMEQRRLEEVDPEVQATMVKQMDSDDVADILENMNPDDAADLLGMMPEKKASGSTSPRSPSPATST